MRYSGSSLARFSRSCAICRQPKSLASCLRAASSDRVSSRTRSWANAAVAAHLFEQATQAKTLGRQRLADQILKGGIARPDDLVLVEVGDQLGDDEAGRDVAANDLRGLLHEQRQEVRRPEPVAEPLGNQNALSEAFMFGDGVRLERLADEVAGQDEGAIVLDIAPGEVEESALGLEVADLQDTVDLRVQAGTAAGERQFRFGQRQILQLLPVVEVGQTVQGELLGI